MITASYLLGSEQKYTAGSVSSEGDSIFYSGISAVKSGSHIGLPREPNLFFLVKTGTVCCKRFDDRNISVHI